MRRGKSAETPAIEAGNAHQGAVRVGHCADLGRSELLATAQSSGGRKRDSAAPLAAVTEPPQAPSRSSILAAALALFAAAALFGFGFRPALEFPHHPALIARYLETGTPKGRELLALALGAGAIAAVSAGIAIACGRLIAKACPKAISRGLAASLALTALGLCLPLPSLLAKDGLFPFLLAAALGATALALPLPLGFAFAALGLVVQTEAAIVFVLPTLALRASAGRNTPQRAIGIWLIPGLCLTAWALWPAADRAFVLPARSILAVYSAIAALLVLGSQRGERSRRPALAAAITAALLAFAMETLPFEDAPRALARGIAIAFAASVALMGDRRPLRFALLLVAALAIVAGELEDRLRAAATWRSEAGLASSLAERAKGLAVVPGIQDFVAGLAPLGQDPRGLAYLWPHADVQSETSLAAAHPERPLRILRFESELPPELSAPSQYRLSPIFHGHIASTEALRLHAPADGEVRSLQNPDDEPVFTWSVPIEQDPGPAGFRFLAVARTTAQPEGGLRARRLSESVLERREEEGRVYYSWRPSLRATEGRIEPELRFEDGDLILAGCELQWTIAKDRGSVGSNHHIAVPRRLLARP